MKLTIKGAIFAKKYSWDDEYTYTFYKCEKEEYPAYAEQGLIFVQEKTISFEELDLNDLRLKHLQALEMKKQKIIANGQIKLNEVEEEIKTLLFLENKRA